MSSQPHPPADSPDVYQIPSEDEIRTFVRKLKGATTDQLMNFFKQRGPYQDKVWASEEFARRVDGIAVWNARKQRWHRRHVRCANDLEPRSKAWREKMEAEKKGEDEDVEAAEDGPDEDDGMQGDGDGDGVSPETRMADVVRERLQSSGVAHVET